MPTSTVASTAIDNVPLLKWDKVRDRHDPGDMLPRVAGDRIACFDVVLRRYAAANEYALLRLTGNGATDQKKPDAGGVQCRYAP